MICVSSAHPYMALRATAHLWGSVHEVPRRRRGTSALRRLIISTSGSMSGGGGAPPRPQPLQAISRPVHRTLRPPTQRPPQGRQHSITRQCSMEPAYHDESLGPLGWCKSAYGSCAILSRLRAVHIRYADCQCRCARERKAAACSIYQTTRRNNHGEASLGPRR
ncbi:hypothetical protein OH77DRAFT_555617 [Trametes cingulata]|nr:hypothetical protein OH77DRAFT_555617 [Trametes cingulata]